jgi:hypothetical protein
MDAITPHSTWFTDPQADGLPGFPELQKLVSSRYELLSGGYKNPGCPGTWARHDVAERLRRRTVPFARITADANIYSEGDVYGARNLDDFSVAEDLCRDEWLLPDARQASVRLDFTQREKVRQVLLLNTHNDGASDRSSRVVRVTLFDHTRTAYRTDVTMAAHPRWTVVTLPTPTDAVALQIDVLSWHGFGGGLNEVKVWR